MISSLILSALLTLLTLPIASAQDTDKNQLTDTADSKLLFQKPDDIKAPLPDKEIQAASKAMFGIDPKNKFSLYQPSYFIFGKDNLKLQFSAKYRVAKNYDLYLAYTQVMFWSIYEKSLPFEDINYNPEIFYRILEGGKDFIRSVDIGHQHTSNGQDGIKSRSINRLFLKTNFATNFGRNNILGEFKLQDIYNKDITNASIVDHMGFWELKVIITHILVHEAQRLDIEYRLFSGKRVVDIHKGGRELGLIYKLNSVNFNPAFYLQYYSGYAETLLHYEKNVNAVRAGLLLFF